MAVDYRGTAMTITARELQYRQSLEHQLSAEDLGDELGRLRTQTLATS